MGVHRRSVLPPDPALDRIYRVEIYRVELRPFVGRRSRRVRSGTVPDAASAPSAAGAAHIVPDVARPAASVGHTVTYDRHSLLVDGHRILVQGAEFHYFRLPSPDLWRDVLEKVRAAGFNTVSL